MLHQKIIPKVGGQSLRWRIYGRGPAPLIFRPKRGPKGRKCFLWDRAPRYLRVWKTAPPPLSEGVDPLLVLLGKKEKWRLCMNRVKPLFEVVAACSPNLRTYLSWSLKNVPLRAELRCIGHYRENTPGFRRKRRKNYTLSLDGLSPHSWLGNHTGKKKHTREESRFLFKFFDIHTYNLGQNSWDINATAGENDAFSLPPSPRFSVDVMDSYLFQRNQHCWGEGYSRNSFFQQHFQAFITGKIRL